MYYFFLLFFIPTIMIVFGVILWRFTPKKNNWFGYRSKKSLKNTGTWTYANKQCGFYWFFAGSIMLIISNIIFFVFYKQDQTNIVKIIKFVVDIITMLAVIPYTEIKLAKNIKNEK